MLIGEKANAESVVAEPDCFDSPICEADVDELASALTGDVSRSF